MKRKMLSAILALVLTAAMLTFGELPMYAAETDTPKSVELGTDAITGWDETNGYHYIYYGDSKYFNVKYGDSNKTYKQQSGDPVGAIKWRVLSGQTNMGTDDGFFLLSEYVFGQSGFTEGVGFNEGVIFNWFQGTILDEHNLYQGSDAQDWCKGFGNTNFSTLELAAVMETTKSDGDYKSPAFPTQFVAVENSLNMDKIFFPSAEEMETAAYGFPIARSVSGTQNEKNNLTRLGTDTAGESWDYWLRSRYKNNGDAGRVVQYWGYVWWGGVNNDCAARPAFNLSKTAVSFIESATGSHTVGKMTAVTDNTTREWKLNLLDSSRNFAVAEASVSGKSSGKITLNYSGAKTGTNEYISALIVNASGEVLYSGILSQASASGEVDIALPADLPAGNYTLKLFNEQANGEKMTDYVSNFADVDLTVEEPFAVFDGIQDTYFHTGLAIEPDFTLTVKQTGKTLVEGTDYTVAWENNTDIGKATVTVTYIGDHVGELAQATTFRIIPGPLPEGKTVDDYLDYNKNWQNVDAVITAKQGYSFSSTNYVDFTESAAFTGTGAFSVSVCIKDDTNNGIIYDFVPVDLKVDKTAPTIRSARATQSATKASIIVQATDNYSGVAAYSFDGGVTWVTTPGTTVYKNGSYTVHVKDTAGNIATYRSPIVVTSIDEIPPTGSIQIGENTWTDFLNSDAVTFELFCSTEETVTILVQDDGGAGIKSAEYFLSEDIYETADAVLAAGDITWTTLTLSGDAGEFSFTADQKAIVYLKITDNANNTTVIRSNGLIIDGTAPVLEGIENEKTYCGAVEVTVSDAYLDKVMVNGNDAMVTDGKFTVAPASGAQTIVASDKAGNTTTYVITVNDGHTLTYAASENVLTETCELCGHSAIATLCRPQDSIHYDGTPHELTVEYSDGWASGKLVVSYSGTAFDGTDYAENGPVSAGYMNASIAIGGATASLENCFIQPSDVYTLGEVSVTAPEMIFAHTPLADIVLGRTNTTIPGTLALVEGQDLSAGSGEYDWIFTPDDMNNYTEISGKVNLTRTEDVCVKVEITTPPTKTEYTYGEAFDTTGMVVTATYLSGLTKEIPLDALEFSPSTLTVATTEVTYTYTADGNEFPVRQEITVNPKVVTVPQIILNANSYTYNGQPIVGVVDDIKDGDTRIPASEYTVEITDNTKVGTATVKIIDNVGGDYIVSGSTTFAITAAQLTEISVEQSGTLTYTGDALVAVVNANATTADGADVIFTYCATQNGEYGSTVPAFTDVDTYTVYFKANAENHEEYSGSFDVVIEKNANGWTTELGISDWTYGDAASEPRAEAKFGAVTYQYYDAKKTELDGVPVNAGDYFIKASVAESANYSALESELVAFTIEQKGVSIRWTAPDSLVFDGTAKLPTALVNSILVGDDELTIEIALTEGNDNVNAGSFTFTAIGVSDQNYKLEGDVESFVYTIAPRELQKSDLIAVTEGFVYTGTAIEPLVESDHELVTAEDLEITYESNVAAGTDTAKIIIVGKNNAIGRVAITFSIAKAKPTVFASPNASRVFINETLSQSALTDGEMKGVLGDALEGDFTWKDGTEVLETKETVKKTVIFTPEDENYEPVEFDVEVEVIICDTESGDHEYTDLQKSETEHWYICIECDAEKPDSRVKHSGGTATCTEKAKCSLCDTAYGDVDSTNHDYKGAWTQTLVEHYRECTRCSDQTDNGSHRYNNACDPTCNTCGYVRAITHRYTALKHNDIEHWYECSTCGKERSGSRVAHKGGTATCTGQALCEVCKAEYGTSNGDNHVFEVTLTVGEDTHYYACSLCGVKKDEAPHRFEGWTSNGDGTHTGTCVCTKTLTVDCEGGVATCTAQAVCATCNTAYGALASDVHSSCESMYISENGTHVKRFLCCGAVDGAAEACSGGTATCVAKAVCEYCGAPYGELAAHTGGTATCTAKAICTVCNESYGEIDPDHHDFDTEWLTDDENHWHKCSRCGKTDGKAAHDYDGRLCECGAEKPLNWLWILILIICIVLVCGFVLWLVIKKRRKNKTA